MRCEEHLPEVDEEGAAAEEDQVIYVDICTYDICRAHVYNLPEVDEEGAAAEEDQVTYIDTCTYDICRAHIYNLPEVDEEGAAAGKEHKEGGVVVEQV